MVTSKGTTSLLTLLLSLQVSSGGSIKYQFQPPNNSEINVGATPDLPSDFFKDQKVVTIFSPVADHHLNRFFTYIYEISGAELCQTVTIVGLEYCYRERDGQVGQNRTHFDFFTLQSQSSEILTSAYTVTAYSNIMSGNCTGVPSKSTVVCCSFQPLTSSPPLTDITHFGITNIQQFPTLLRLPDPDTATFYARSKSTFDIPVPQSPDLRTYSRTEGHVPSLRLYFKCPPSNLTLSPSTTDNPENLSADSGNFNLTQILIYAGIAIGCFLFVVIASTIAAIVGARACRTKKERTKKEMIPKMPAPQDKGVYNTLDTVKPLRNPDRYSTLDQDWLPNSAYSSNTPAENHELRDIKARQFQSRGASRYNTNSVATARVSDVYYSSIKPLTPPRRADYSIQPNIAYHNNGSPTGQDHEPQYSNAGETDQPSDNTQFYAVPKYADTIPEQEDNC